jgi:hypothetical protein
VSDNVLCPGNKTKSKLKIINNSKISASAFNKMVRVLGKEVKKNMY